MVQSSKPRTHPPTPTSSQKLNSSGGAAAKIAVCVHIPLLLYKGKAESSPEHALSGLPPSPCIVCGTSLRVAYAHIHTT